MGPGYNTLKPTRSDVLSPARLHLLRVTMESSEGHFKDTGNNIYIGLGQGSRCIQLRNVFLYDDRLVKYLNTVIRGPLIMPCFFLAYFVF